jgi:flagellar biosynthesis anti-sigma factor FlgM
LSELSSHLHALESSLAADSAFDPVKVEAIKQAIRDGTLSVNAEVIGDRMLAGLRDLFGKGRP